MAASMAMTRGRPCSLADPVAQHPCSQLELQTEQDWNSESEPLVMMVILSHHSVMYFLLCCDFNWLTEH